MAKEENKEKSIDKEITKKSSYTKKKKSKKNKEKYFKWYSVCAINI